MSLFKSIQILPIILLFLLIAPQVNAQEETSRWDGIRYNETGFTVGYRWADLKDENPDDDFASIPVNLRFGWDISSVFGLEDHKGTIQKAVEPFVHGITDPDGGVEVGVNFMFRYSYPTTEKISPYIEFGSGPMYFGIDTAEQDQDGFNFLNQGGVGLLLKYDDDKAVNIGYRYWHISHNGFRDSSNNGINGSAVYGGLSWLY